MSETKESGGCGSGESGSAAGGNAFSPSSEGRDGSGAAAPGSMNAYDIPRYNAEGYVQGRPRDANDPTSAGMSEGAMGGNMAQGQATMGGDPMQQPGYQVPLQGVGYMGGDMAQGQAAMGGDPMQQPRYQVPPQGMGYMGGDPMQQTVYQQPQAAPGYIADGAPAEQYGRIADVVGDIANGEQPDVNKIVSLFNGFDAGFWKGALVGAVVTVLLTNDTVKSAIAGTVGGIFGAIKTDEVREGASQSLDTDAAG